jgi:DNA-binding SARP family transcriptional activator
VSNPRASEGLAGQPGMNSLARDDPQWGTRADPGSHGGAMTLALQVLDSYPYGIIVARRDGSVVAHNPAAARLLGKLAERLQDPNAPVLCDVLDCRAEAAPLDGLSLIERAVRERRVLPEVRIDLPPGASAAAAWVTVAPLGDSDDLVIAELRPGRANDRRRRTTPHWTRGPRLKIYALGRTRIESAEGPIGGQWLENRAGQMLKFLVAERHRVVYPDEIVETLWEDARLRSVPGVRYYIHQLRQHLEPDRAGRGQSSFIGRLEGGYVLRRESVVVDADEFERHVGTGLAAADAGDEERASSELEQGLALYGGDFLADEPYAEWAIPERDRLRSVAANGLRVLAELRLARDDLAGAAADLERLAELEPYDPEVHRRLIAVALRRGRRTEAVRRYNALRRRMIATFGEDVDFTLADVASS